MPQVIPRGTRVRIISGRYAGRSGTVHSNVFQKTVDFPEEADEAVHLHLDDDGPRVTVRRDQVSNP